MVKLPSTARQKPLDAAARLRVSRRTAVALGLMLAVALMVLLRLVALDSDAYPRLSWSSALLTDEGFYIHDARNRVLFGVESTDQFSNRLLMPALHLLQVAVFSVFGVGAVQARMISIVLSLLMVGLFYAALRRAFGGRVAWIGALFLGLDHVGLLYHRLALMDTPAACVLVGAFYAFVRAVTIEEKGRRGEAGARLRWLFLGGALLGVAYMTRGLTALVYPVPFAALWWGRRDISYSARKRDLLALGAGLLLALAFYGVWWYLPNRAELMRTNHYYITEQLLPRSWHRFRVNVTQALFGVERGMLPYLFRHTPVQMVLGLMALLGLGMGLTTRFARDTETQRGEREGSGERLCALFLGGWLVVAWALFAVVSYAPSRYFVLFYPALAGLAALALDRLMEISARLWASRWARATLGGILTCQLALGLIEPHSVWGDRAVYGLTLGVVLALLWRGGALLRLRQSRIQHSISEIGRGFSQVSSRMQNAILVLVVMVGWGGVDLYWTADWLTHLTYRQKGADRWLAEHLPPDSVLIGAVAPGLCLNNRFKVVNVIEKLCNVDHPVETFAPAPRYILILDDKWKERWWVKNYPALVAPERRQKAFRGMLRPFFTIGVYPVE